MTSKSHILDIQNEESEIDLQFQDFDSTPSHQINQDASKSQAVYFSSFSDSIDDDQEQKLLGDETEDSRSKASQHSFWTFEYYQQYFDVESKQVADRIVWSMVPKPGVNYLQSYIRPNPDLYGPFWICITLVLTTAVAGNLSNYLQATEVKHWRYDFHKVTLATSSIFSYAWLVPVLIWGVLLWRGSKANVTLLEMICLYGYSLAIFVPVSLLWMIPLRWLQWCLGIVASVLSGSVLVRTIKPAVSHEAKKVALGLAVLVLVLHAALALGFMLYFFYPPASGIKPLTAAKPLDNSNFPSSVSSEDVKKQAKEIGKDDSEVESKEKPKVNKQERSEDIKANVPDPGIVEQAAEGKLPAEDKKKERSSEDDPSQNQSPLQSDEGSKGKGIAAEGAGTEIKKEEPSKLSVSNTENGKKSPQNKGDGKKPVLENAETNQSVSSDDNHKENLKDEKSSSKDNPEKDKTNA